MRSKQKVLFFGEGGGLSTHTVVTPKLQVICIPSFGSEKDSF